VTTRKGRGEKKKRKKGETPTSGSSVQAEKGKKERGGRRRAGRKACRFKIRPYLHYSIFNPIPCREGGKGREERKEEKRGKLD